MTPEARAEARIERLPTTLGAALDRLESSSPLAAAMGDSFLAAYLCHKRSEIERAAGFETAQLIEQYVEAY